VTVSLYIMSLIRQLTSRATSPWLTKAVALNVRAASTGPSLDLRGVYPPIVTPFNKDESLAYDKLQANMSIWNAMPFRGYLVEGSNGEYVYLTYEERISLVKTARELVPKDSGKIILAGSGCESTFATIDMSCKMAEAGADAVMVVTPCYYKNAMKDSALHAHFTAVADNSPIPVILYSVPANTGIDLSPTVVADLAKHKNIIGMKDSGGDITKIGSMLHLTKDADFQILAGSAGFLLTALQLGCVGGVCALANVLGGEVCRLQSLYEEGNIQEAVALQYRLIGPNSAVTKQLGVSGLKQSMDWLGLYGGPTRTPILPLTDGETLSLKTVFEKNGFLVSS